MKIDRTFNEQNIPVIIWQEPRWKQEWGLGVFDHPTMQEGRCWVFCDVGEEPKFWHEFVNENGTKSRVGVVYDNINAFALTTAMELYGDSSMKGEYAGRPGGNPSILYADLIEPLPNSNAMLIPLTYTIAPRVELMQLHAVLTQTFIANRAALMKKAIEAAEMEKRRNEVNPAHEIIIERLLDRQVSRHYEILKWFIQVLEHAFEVNGEGFVCHVELSAEEVRRHFANGSVKKLLIERFGCEEADYTQEIWQSMIDDWQEVNDHMPREGYKTGIGLLMAYVANSLERREMKESLFIREELLKEEKRRDGL